jgi:ADP-dependent NAD(P)H-hydrate dehydratase / NAD(P)H-hydrate epimerase
MTTPRQTVLRLLDRPLHANKYDFGHVLVMGGSPGMVGAPLLAGEAALRVGAGLVTIASDAHTVGKLERRVEEIMTLTISERPKEAVDALATFIKERSVAALVAGPGLRPEYAPVVTALLDQVSIPAVIDAGALIAFHNHLSLLRKIAQHNSGLVLTPHTGEYEKLNAGKLPRDEAVRKQAVVTFAKKHHITLVLKGYHSWVVHPDGTLYQNQTGNPGLATAGTGDVLSGIIAGILAQGVSPAEAAEAAVYVHGLAADLAAASKTEPAMIASDLLEFIPAALKKSAL